jgi:glycyl-tRNA synthetase
MRIAVLATQVLIRQTRYTLPTRTFTNMTVPVNKTAHAFNKQQLESVLTQRFFYAPAFEIYGGKYDVFVPNPRTSIDCCNTGVAGLYDYGPPGSALQANIINEWRKHFIVEDSMLELDTTVMTPAPVFEASGHVARFADWMVKDTKTGEVLRADHLVKAVLEARLAGDKEARGMKVDVVDSEKDKKRKKKAKSVAVKLADEVVSEYETILAQVSHTIGVAQRTLSDDVEVL